MKIHIHSRIHLENNSKRRNIDESITCTCRYVCTKDIKVNKMYMLVKIKNMNYKMERN